MPAIAGCGLNPRAIRIIARWVGLYGCGNTRIPAAREDLGTS